MPDTTQSTSLSQINGSAGIPHKIAVRLPKALGNLLIYIFTLGLFYLLKYNNLNITSNYINLLPVYLLAWVTGGIISGKFRFQSSISFLSNLNKSYTSLLISLGVVAFFMIQSESLSASRLVVVGSFFSGLIIENLLYMVTNKVELIKATKSGRKISFTAPIIDFLLLTWVIYFLYDYKIGFSRIDENQIILLSSTYISWFLAALITHQFSTVNGKTNVWHAISLQLKFYLLIAAMMTFIVYILQIAQYYKSIYMMAILIYSVWSFIVMLFLYIEKLPHKTDDVTADFLHAYEIKAPAIKNNGHDLINTKYRLSNKSSDNSLLTQRLEFIYFKKYPELLSFLERKIELSTFDVEKTSILKSRDTYNVSIYPEDYLEIFINLHKINDIRRINEYFIEVNKRLCKGGIFVGNFEPTKYRYERFRNKYPFIVANSLYLFDFIWKRAMPKLPIIRKIYFVLTRGQDRALSLAEGLGRLYYCGFEILDLKIIDKLCYFIAKKVSAPSEDKNPSFSPIIKMRRTGINGKPVYVYKLRTMHPYSEYLQKFIYENNNLQDGGKFNKDFRITKWGIILRKLWVDELPMLFNLIKGDIKFVGVRPISEQYLSLYNAEYRKRRMNYKPGLIPPYYADMPRNLSDIINSERKYLDEYDRNKILTDVKYFFKALNNIVIKKERSA